MPSQSYSGQYEHRLDDRGRIAIPADFRASFGTDGYLMPGADGQLELHSREGYEEIKQTRTDAADQSAEGRSLRRLFFGHSFRVQADRQGRIVIPAELRELRGINGVTFIVGMGDYFEIWSEAAWRAESSQLDENYADLLEGLARIADAPSDEAEPS